MQAFNGEPCVASLQQAEVGAVDERAFDVHVRDVLAQRIEQAREVELLRRAGQTAVRIQADAQGALPVGS